MKVSYQKYLTRKGAVAALCILAAAIALANIPVYGPFCLTGKAYADDQLARAFVVQHILNAAYAWPNASVPKEEVVQWSPKALKDEPGEHGWPDEVVGWAFLAESSFGVRSVDLMAYQDCQYEIRISPILK